MTRQTIRRLLCGFLAFSTLGSVRLVAQDALDAAPEPPSTLLADEPETPEEQFDAVLLMLRLDRPDLAKVYLNQFLAGEPSDELLLNLRDTKGTSTFLSLSRLEDLHPESQQLLQQLQMAATRQLDDPAYFDSLLTQLEGAPREREAALTAIRQLGSDAVPGLIERLGQGDRIQQHSLLVYTLTKMGSSAVQPLLGATESPVERTRALAVEALGWIGSEANVPRLWSLAFGADQPQIVKDAARRAIARIRYGSADMTDRVTFNGVVDEVRQRAIQHFAGDYDWNTDDQGQVIVWSWDTSQNRLTKTVTTSPRASAFLAQRLARQAMLMAPERQDLSELFLATSLAEAGYRAGWDQPWPVGPGTAHNLAMFSGTETTEGALALAVEHQNAAAAVGALKALGQVGTLQTLVESELHRSPVIAALNFPHDRVQFAAASCVLQIDPQQAFAASHRVVDILARSLSDSGAKASVVIDPNSQRAAGVAALLSSLGYQTEVAATGREGFQAATSRGDVALAVMHPNTIRWELTQTVANFRTDARTAGIPVAIYGPQPVQEKLQRLLERTADSKFIVTGGEASDWQRQLASLVSAVDIPPLTAEQHRQRIATAAYWLRHIADGRRTDIYDLAPAESALSSAIQDPAIAADAVVALAAIPQPSVQRRLAETVTAPGVSAEIRVSAAWQLNEHARDYGRLLTEAGIDELKAVWQSTDDSGIRTALTAVLGTLGASGNMTGAALQSHALSPTP